MYKAIFFDLDGTLTESGEGITKSVQYALEKLGVSAPDLEPLKVFVGPPLLEQFMKYAGFDKETAQKGIEYYRERYSEKGMYENTVYPGVENALAELKRRGYRLAVASAKPTFYVTQIMDHFNLSRYFEVIAGTDLNGPKVTKSQVIEEALERMSLSDHRDQVIMVGDREHDILGARRCGIQCVAVSYGYGSREELEKAQPLQIVASADELLNFFRLTPLHRQNIFQIVWRELYPAGIHYLIGQILGSAVLLWLAGHVGNAQERYYSYTLVITGLTGVLVMFPAVYFYRKDRIGRLIGGLTSVEEQRLSIPEMLLLLAAGAGFAQYANVLVAILQNWISSSYGETMTKITSGKSLFMMIFWMGIIAPVAEEMIFRWLIYLRLRDHFSVLVSAVISAAFFGIYHGNVLQAVYAFVLGGISAWFLEMGGNKWTSVLMHIGANTWILIFSEYAQTLVEKAGAGSLLMIYGVFAAAMIGGYQYFARRGEKRGYRAV